jgi:hypothetical protein
VRRAFPLALTIAACSSACGGAAELAPKPASETPRATTAAAPRAETPERWPESTRSAWPETAEATEPLASACGSPDAALTRVAVQFAEERARGLGSPDPDAVVARMRAAGVPHTRPRVLTASAHGPLGDDLMRSKLATLRADDTRCGVGTARTPHGGEVLVAIAVDELAELAPLPLRARTGEWLTFDARLHVGARAAKLVVLGPRGAPRTVPTSLDPRGHATARFALDRPGAFLVQLVADTDGGPRPLLEARVFADVEPSRDADAAPAPGEDSGDLARMIAAVREAERLAPVVHDVGLDAIAQRHADQMRDAHKLAHDVGDGDPRSRFEAADLDAKAMGENVAHAETVALAHRALYASPSHRMNLLRPDFTHVGVGVAQADDGTVYVCEVFAARGR